MSNRNARRTAPASAARAAKARQDSITSESTFDLSSDDNNYSGVDDVSDDEDDDEDVFAAEEEAMMDDASTNASQASTPRPPESDGENDDDESNDDHEEEEEETPWKDNDDESSASWSGIDNYNPPPVVLPWEEQGGKRRVHFDVPPEEDDDSSSDDTEDDHADFYPDIFVSQASLDPSFRRQIEGDNDDSASDSFWDYATYESMFENNSVEGDYENDDLFSQASPEKATQAPEADPQLDQVLSGFKELDGYETDGETTEDDEFPEPVIRRRTPRPSISEHDGSDSDTDDAASVRSKKDKPRSTRFDLNRLKNKPVAIYDARRKKMIIFTPKQRGLDLSPEHFNGEALRALYEQGNPQMMPFAPNGANTMIDPFGPQYMFTEPTPQEFDMFWGNDLEYSPSFDDGSSLPRDSSADPEGEGGLRVDDFIELDGCESSNDEGDDPLPSSTPMRPTTASSDIDVLGHLNSSTVGAFRRNQANSQLLLRTQATQDSLDFSGPYHNTAIRGIRSDRFETAGVPLTPVRRHKKQLSDINMRSPLEPVSAKRKASAEVAQGGHKKQKSISDVGSLHL